jgi:hypothetical protein
MSAARSVRDVTQACSWLGRRIPRDDERVMRHACNAAEAVAHDAAAEAESGSGVVCLAQA